MRIFLLIGILCIIGVTIGCGGAETESTAPSAPVVVEEASASSTETSAIPIIVGTGSDPYFFEPKGFELQAGQNYAFEVTSYHELHSFTVMEIGLNVNVMPNTTEIIDVKFDKPGTYKLICLPHEIYDMVATIKVN